MKNFLILCFFLIIAFLIIRGNMSIQKQTVKTDVIKKECHREICGEVEEGETLYHIFKKYQLDLGELLKLKEASADIHRLKNLSPGQPYKIILDNNSGINSFTYWIDDDNILHITKTGTGFSAKKEVIEYKKRILYMRGFIKDNLITSVGEGTVLFSGYKGQFGNLLIIHYPNGWKTYYGHLSKIEKNVRKGEKVYQGQIIGYVGATGLATGPHLHYEMRLNNKPVNPLTVKMPRGKSISKTLLSEFKSFKTEMDMYMASARNPDFALVNQQNRIPKTFRY